MSETPTQRFVPMLVYKDAPRAIEFLCDAFGFKENSRLDMPEARVGHAELEYMGHTVTLSSEYEEMGLVSPQSLSATGYLGFSLADEGWVMLVFIVPFALGSLAIPALRSILSHRVGADAQGELQGAMSSLMSLTAIVAPVFLTQLFGYFTSASAPVYFPGAPFMTAAVLTMGSAVVVAGVLFSRREPVLG